MLWEITMRRRGITMSQAQRAHDNLTPEDVYGPDDEEKEEPEEEPEPEDVMKKQIRDMIIGTAAIEGTTEQCALRDLLTDVRHVVDELGLDLHEALDGSYQVYLEEK
jgi:hypothetical protein